MNLLFFLLGWAACIVFIAACEIIPQIIANRRDKAVAEAERAASLTEMVCPWPIARERDRASSHDVSDPTR